MNICKILSIFNKFIFIFFLVFFSNKYVLAQYGITVNMAGLDGVEITPQNIFNYQINSDANRSINCTINGVLTYRTSGMKISYTYTYLVKPGINQMNADMLQASWQYSSTALRELFVEYGKLPQGTYEYCVNIQPLNTAGEKIPADGGQECLFYKVDDIFLINLVDPENDAKIYEYNPMLSWTVNYPFASALTYRLRIAELKKGQNPENAVTRNNPVYDERNLVQTSVTYPAYARPLQVFQPYVWTVDAYYKGILLGGSEIWKFTIIEDTLFKAVPGVQSYYDFISHYEDTRLFAVGELKLMYRSEQAQDTLTFRLFDAADKEIRLPQPVKVMQPGDNRIILEFYEKINLGHGKKYSVTISAANQKKYTVPFTYINPLYQK